MGMFREFMISFLPGQDGCFFMWVLAALAVAALIAMAERWRYINQQTGIDTPRFFDRLSDTIKRGTSTEALRLCESGKQFVVARVMGAGIRRSESVSELALSAMEEETLHELPKLERRLGTIAVIGNLATLIGLMGTIYGLILAFAAVARPDVSPVEKSSMLATGISAAMNTTLLGLVIAVPCVLGYSMFRERVDRAIADIDRYTIALLKVLSPEKPVNRSFKVSSMRLREEVETEPNMVPFMNLMVVLIPLLLSSSEFVKLGMIELKLPESTRAGEGGAGIADDAKLDLGIVVTSKGFDLFHYFKTDSPDEKAGGETEIPLINGAYDFKKLNERVVEVKRRVLYEIVKTAGGNVTHETDVGKLNVIYSLQKLRSVKMFDDHEKVKIVAEDAIGYQTVISVMDAARGVMTSSGAVTLFPNVSLAGGMVQ